MKLNRPALLSLAIAAAVVARADDFSPPSWRLSNSSATVQEWDFFTPSSGLVADGNIWGTSGSGYVNANGAPQFLTSTGTWGSSFNGHNGLWGLQPGENMDFVIPNDGPDPDSKEMWFQLTTWNNTGALVFPDIFVQSPSFSGFANMVSVNVTTTGWQQTVWSLTMPDCPAFERVNITNNGFSPMLVDQFVVDTICNPTPEPATMLALGAGLAGVIARRRKRA